MPKSFVTTGDRPIESVRARQTPGVLVALVACAFGAGCAALENESREAEEERERMEHEHELEPLSPTAPISVGILIVDGVYDTELMAPCDVFHHTALHATPGMQVFTVARSTRPVRTFEGLRLIPDYDFEDAPAIDVLVVPSAEHSMGRDLDDEELLEFVRERAERARYVVSLCDGAFVLAQAHVLTDHSCTTFPADVGRLRERFPALDVQTEMSFVQSGKIITSQGGVRSYDAALYLTELIYGMDVAQEIGRGLCIDWELGRVPYIGTIDKAGPPEDEAEREREREKERERSQRD